MPCDIRPDQAKAVEVGDKPARGVEPVGLPAAPFDDGEP
jgi:hypothetical protein